MSLSNGNADLNRVGLGPYFRAAISAREFGVGKPDSRIFHAAAGAVDLTPADVLHVGDDATLDALGGRLFAAAHQAVNKLRRQNRMILRIGLQLGAAGREL